MLEVIEKMLILQDRDKKILRVKESLLRVEPERRTLQAKAATVQASLDTVKNRLKQIEADRKKLELDVEAKKGLISRYSVQQFETKKNDEYRALGRQIDECKAAITALEDQEIELMEQTEAAQKELQAVTRSADEVKKAVNGQLKVLAQNEASLKAELTELESSRKDLAAPIDLPILSRYERILKQKGDRVVVGIIHGVCGGCHMRFPTQVIVSCQTDKELIACPNCGRILYWTPDMDMTVAD